MSTEQDPKKIESEPKEETKPADQLANEELDQVVGGSGPASVAAPTLPTVSIQPNASEWKTWIKGENPSPNEGTKQH